MISEVAQGVYRISLAWSNVYLLRKGEDAALIDTGLQKDRPLLLDALRQVGVRPEQVRAVYLTHAHCDHGGNAAFFSHKNTGTGGRAQIHTGQAEAPYLGLPMRTYAPKGIQRLLRPLSTLLFLAGEKLYPVERCGVDCLLKEGDKIDAPGGDLRVVASPGHTPGHMAYFRERDGLLFSGDAILNIIPIRRVTALSLSIPCLCTEWKQTRQSARLLTGLRPRILLAGHGLPLSENTADRLCAWAQTI